tara:strand:- start:1605 stop:2324 length:720 start_codon:yes stop_codon:yes gene_type:complete
MIDGKTILGLIPARGGSKGLPQKNILPLLGTPLISWSIKSAESSKYIDKCIVSTDDNEIAQTAESYGGEVPFIRPEYLANDETSTIDVIIHAVNYFQEMSIVFDYLILLEPTSPLRETQDIDRAIEMLHEKREKADSIVGVSKVEATHPAFDVTIGEKGLIKPYLAKSFKVFRRQEIQDLYFFEGTVYISKTEVLINRKSFYHDRTLPYIVPRWKSIEIDEKMDLMIAETLLKNKHQFD